MGGRFLTIDLPTAVILAGGLGTRLKGIVPELPKSMAPVLGKPFLEHQLGLLARHGMRNFILCTGYRHESIQRYFQEGSRWEWNIRYSVEATPLGTGGALRNARPLISGSFLLLNGDTYLDIDYGEFAESHRERALNRTAIGSIAVREVRNSRAFGCVILGPEEKILSFHEKSREPAGPGLINAGAYIFDERFFRYVPKAGWCSLEYDVIPHALKEGAALYGYPAKGAFVDIGTKEGYERLQALLGKKKPVIGSG